MTAARAWPVVLCLLVAACSASKSVPAWRADADAALERFRRHYLEGDTRLATGSYEEARRHLSATGEPALGTRAELIRCATGTAALDFGACAVLDRADAPGGAEDRAYSAFLAGRWAGLDAGRLPEQYRGLLKARPGAEGVAALEAIDPPLSRLIAAGVLFRRGELPPEGVALAVSAASAEGWRRPLLAWLTAHEKLLAGAGDAAGAARVRQRIEYATGGR